jgi:two-component system, chemotaxis family, protein-glutamate methylesterase/glutaminase
MPTIRVLVADDSALMRQTLKRMISAEPGMEVAGTARDGEDAVAKARELRPDVVTMDINMPKLDGITALQLILEEKICPVVMVSSLTQRGALTTFECLELGAFDFVAKPDGTVSSNLGSIAAELGSKLRAAAASGVLERVHKQRIRRGAVRPPVPPPAPRWDTHSPVAVAIGISTGGPATLTEVLPVLPADLPASVFLVQHMPATFLTAFARRLNENCALEVVEGRAGMAVEPGHCYVAPGGLHLCPYRKASTGEIVIRTPAQPRTLFIPSVNVMMRAVRETYGPNTVGVLMTGIGDDGADEMVSIRKAGGITIAESEETAVVFGMPREAIERGGADIVAPHYQVAQHIVQAVGKAGAKK